MKKIQPGGTKNPNRRNSNEHHVRIRPEILTKPDRTVGYQKGAKGEGITHQKIPHHQFAVLHVEGALTTAPPFGLMYCRCLC